MRLNQFAALPLLLIAAACSDDTSRTEPIPKQAAEPVPVRFDRVSTDPIEQGERLFAVLGCIGCHKLDLTGDDWSDPDYGVLWTANLTQSASTYSENELTTMITDGRRSDRALMDMPSYLFSAVHPEDLAALVRYMKTLPAIGEKHPEPTIGPQLEKEIASGDFKDSVQWVAEMKNQAPPDIGPDHAFARLILRATCAECHGMDLQGSAEGMADAPPPPTRRMVIAYSLDDFSTLMKTGKALGNRDLEMMGGVARGRYSRFTDNEIEAIYNYLVALARSDL